MSSQVFPNHLAIPPQTADHTHTFILLQEGCSNFSLFERSLLACRLPLILPTLRLVFPAAPKSTATKSVQAASQLADSWLQVHPLKGPEQDLDEPKEVLCKAAERIRGIIHEEARILGERGYQRIVLWDLGEGCAAGIFTLIGGWFTSREKCALGAFVGLSGWLPRAMELEDILRGVDIATADDHLHATKVQDESDQPEKKLTYSIECPESKHYTPGPCISDGHASSSKEAGLTCQVH